MRIIWASHALLRIDEHSYLKHLGGMSDDIIMTDITKTRDFLIILSNLLYEYIYQTRQEQFRSLML